MYEVYALSDRDADVFTDRARKLEDLAQKLDSVGKSVEARQARDMADTARHLVRKGSFDSSDAKLIGVQSDRISKRGTGMDSITAMIAKMLGIVAAPRPDSEVDRKMATVSSAAIATIRKVAGGTPEKPTTYSRWREGENEVAKLNSIVTPTVSRRRYEVLPAPTGSGERPEFRKYIDDGIKAGVLVKSDPQDQQAALNERFNDRIMSETEGPTVQYLPIATGATFSGWAQFARVGFKG